MLEHLLFEVDSRKPCGHRVESSGVGNDTCRALDWLLWMAGQFGFSNASWRFVSHTAGQVELHKPFQVLQAIYR